MMNETSAKPGVLLLHAWWGRNGVIMDVARRLEAEGFVVEAPDLYGGVVVDTVAEAQAMVDGLDGEAAYARVVEALEALRSNPAANGRAGVVAFSLGVWFSFMLAVQRPEEVDAVVAFYGTYSDNAEGMRAPVLAHLASDDPFEPAEAVEAMRGALGKAGVPAELHVYPGTAHWFFEPDRPEYQAEAAGLAWERTVAFLRERLG